MVIAEATYTGNNMALDTSERKATTYFIGTEVENTAMKGERTLFVVGVRPVDEIVAQLNKVGRNDIRHIYLGTSQSFTPQSYDDWKAWDKMIMGLLGLNYWVTLDFGVEHADTIHEEGWCENNRFIPMISVKLPYIKLYNYNATLKIDDTTWGHSNPGVWCHSLHDLMDRKVYTDWKDYVGDEEI
jgi:hypothetical protein